MKSHVKRIQLVEAGDELMPDAYDTPEERYWTIFCMSHEFARNSRDSLSAPETDTISMHLRSKCVEIMEDGIRIEDETGARKELKADTVIMATGLRPDRQKVESFEKSAYDVIEIGDCDQVGSLLGTSSSAYRAAFRI